MPFWSYRYLLCITEVFSQAPWLELKELQDPMLKELAGKLPGTVLHSRAESTTKKYMGAFRRWKAWAVQHQLPVLPAKESHVALYLQHIGETVQSKSAAEDACNALAWIHSTAGLVSPISSPLVKVTLQRILARLVHKKAPATVRMLEQMVDEAKQSGTLADMRLTAACLVAFAGFLRFSELIELKTSDVTFREDAMVIKISHSKNDQLRRGDEVIIARSDRATCPVAYLESYLRRTGTSLQEQRFVFRPICNSKKGEHLRDAGNISYSCLWEHFKKKVSKLGYDHTEFGLHSLRAGAAANAGVLDRLFKRHGRWKSKSAKDGYVDDSVERRLSVTRQLGL